VAANINNGLIIDDFSNEVQKSEKSILETDI